MDEKRFRQILHRYFVRTTSKQDADLLQEFDQKMRQKTPRVFKSDAHREKVKTDIKKGLPITSAKKQYRLLKIAASLTILIGLGVMGVTLTNDHRSSQVPTITFATDWGQRQDIVLPDGTKVTLNAGSTISYPQRFTASKRNVTLSGEAFFEVVKNTAAPFTIHTDEVTTTVLGTSFNINTQDKEHISVTVATGKVRVASDHDNEVILTPNQQATYNPTSQTISTREVSLDKYLDWKAGILRFENVTIAEASKKLEQWYNVSIKVLNNDIANCRFSGTFNNEKLTTVLESLGYLKSDMEYTILENDEIHIKGTCN